MCQDSKGVIYLNSDNISYGSKKEGYFDKINQTGIKKVGCASYKFISSITNINSNNNQAVIDTGTQSYPITIQIDQYTEAQLATAVQTELNTLGLGSFTVVYNVNIQQFVITAPIPITIVSNPISNFKDFFDMMGIKKDEPVNINISSAYAVDMEYTNCVYIVSNELNKSRTKNEFNSAYIINHLVCIYLDTPSQRIENIKWIDVYGQDNINLIDIVVLDEQGRELPTEQFKYILELYTV